MMTTYREICYPEVYALPSCGPAAEARCLSMRHFNLIRQFKRDKPHIPQLFFNLYKNVLQNRHRIIGNSSHLMVLEAASSVGALSTRCVLIWKEYLKNLHASTPKNLNLQGVVLFAGPSCCTM